MRIFFFTERKNIEILIPIQETGEDTGWEQAFHDARHGCFSPPSHKMGFMSLQLLGAVSRLRWGFLHP